MIPMNFSKVSFSIKIASSVFLLLLTMSLILSFPTANAQETWEIDTVHGVQLYHFSVHMLNSSEGWIVGSGPSDFGTDGKAYQYNGTTWNEQTHNGYGQISVFMVNSSDVWAGGWGGSMWHWNGTKWKSFSGVIIGTQTRNSIFMVNSTEGWCVSTGGIILHHNSSGWSKYAPRPINRDLNSVYMVNSTDGWIVGKKGTILHYSSGTWNNYTSPTTKDLKSVFMVNSTEGWAVGGSGTILHYTGGTWNNYTSPTTKDLFSVFMVNSTEGWAVGHRHILKYSESGGAQIMELSTKCGDVLFEVDAGNIENLTSVPAENMPAKPSMDFICDFFSFNITELTPGQTVNITITFPNPVPTNATLWKHGPTTANPVPQWYQVPFGDNDGDNVIIVQFQDGGVGDNDLTANGVIMEPSGIGIPYPPPPLPLAGELVPNNLTSISTLLIAGISTIAVILAIVNKKNKLFN